MNKFIEKINNIKKYIIILIVLFIVIISIVVAVFVSKENSKKEESQIISEVIEESTTSEETTEFTTNSTTIKEKTTKVDKESTKKMNSVDDSYQIEKYPNVKEFSYDELYNKINSDYAYFVLENKKFSINQKLSHYENNGWKIVSNSDNYKSFDDELIDMSGFDEESTKAYIESLKLKKGNNTISVYASGTIGESVRDAKVTGISYVSENAPELLLYGAISSQINVNEFEYLFEKAEFTKTSRADCQKVGQYSMSYALSSNDYAIEVKIPINKNNHTILWIGSRDSNSRNEFSLISKDI